MFKKGSILLLITFICIHIFTINVLAFKLEFGDKGENVLEIQQDLYDLGYDVDLDGVFGYQTKEVIRDFQYSNGLTVDGIIGDETRKKLKNLTEDLHYIVKAGDTLSEIAITYNTTARDIKKINNLKSDFIKIGQNLLIPNTGIGDGEDEKIYNNIIHQIQPGDVLSILAKKYGTDVETIKLANNIKNDMIYAGQDIVIPHLDYNYNKPFTLYKGAFIWPVLGPISSGYGYRIHPIRKTKHFHGGIDIAVSTGNRIRTTASGTVEKSGYINGFGKTVVIDHGNGIKTLYAHNSRLLVRSGTTVHTGQTIALSGSTGTSTGPHLDFRIYENEKTINPLKYLP